MNTKHLVLFSLCISIALVSCQKQLSLDYMPSTGGNNNTLAGEYSLVNMRLQATSTGTFTEVGVQVKSITVTDYTSKNNQGTVVIDNSQFITNNISYSIDTTLKAYFYADGVLQDSVDAPFAMDMPAYSGNSPYTKVGSDSLTFTSGFITVPSGTGIPVQNAPSGARYSWSGDTLILKTAFNMNSTQVISGTTVTILYQGNQWTRLKKK